MNTRARHIILNILQLFLIVFWLYVALDKMWSLKAFHISLLRQPFPNWWADILYWSLPLAELGIALLFVAGSIFPVIQRSKATSESGKRGTTGITLSLSKGLPFLLSSLLLLIFTVYIALGVAGLYAKKPCGCASVFSGLSWEWHLLVNLMLLGLSILGRFLCEPTAPTDYGRKQYANSTGGRLPIIVRAVMPIFPILYVVHKRFPRKFALFPGRPVSV